MLEFEPCKAYRGLPASAYAQPARMLMILIPTHQLPKLGSTQPETIESQFLPNHLDSGQVYNSASSVRSLERSNNQSAGLALVRRPLVNLDESCSWREE